MTSKRKPACRIHAPVLTAAHGGTALYEVCSVCKRLRRNDSEAESRFHLPVKRWERATVAAVVRHAR